MNRRFDNRRLRRFRWDRALGVLALGTVAIIALVSVTEQISYAVFGKPGKNTKATAAKVASATTAGKKPVAAKKPATPSAPVSCAATGATLVNHAYITRKRVALTFDDGPGPLTPAFLSVLAKNKVHATFFMIGRQVPSEGAIVRRVLAEGHVIGNHTWDHRMPGVGIGNEFSWTQSAIKKAANYTPCLSRTPGGVISPTILQDARKQGLLVIKWDVDPDDWQRPAASTIASRVLSNVRPGAIILMHDGGGPREHTLAALPTIIAGLKARGYEMVTVPELLNLPKSTPGTNRAAAGTSNRRVTSSPPPAASATTSSATATSSTPSGAAPSVGTTTPSTGQ